MKVTFRVEKQNGDLYAASRDVRSNSARLAQRLAQAIARYAKELAPVGSIPYEDKDGNFHPGYLKKSIVARKVSEGEWEVEVGAFYGVYVEYGTRYMNAQPYMTPAVERAKREYRNVDLLKLK